MGGTLHGLVNKRVNRIGASDYQNLGQYFSLVAAFFDHLSTPSGGNYMTRVASNYGGGSGFNPRGQALGNEVGDAPHFGVWKMNTSTLRPGGGTALGEVYIFLFSNYDDYTPFWSLRIGGATSNRAGFMGISMAFREDGDNPWNGTMNNNGLDTPGDPIVWTEADLGSGASTVHAFPRSNNPGGSYNTDKDNLQALGAEQFRTWDIPYAYFHGIADADNFAIFITSQYGLKEGDSPDYFATWMFGLGESKPGALVDPYCCYFFLDEEPAIGFGGSYGTTGDTEGNDGGIKPPGDTVGTFYLEGLGTGLSSTRQPSPYALVPGTLEEATPLLVDYFGWIGFCRDPGGSDFWRYIYGAPNEGYDATSKRAAFGHPNLQSLKITVPWPDSIGVAPGGTRSYAGEAF